MNKFQFSLNNEISIVNLLYYIDAETLSVIILCRGIISN